MRIDLNPDSIPFKHRPYWLNPKFKEKVKKEIDKMLTTGLIFLVSKVE